MAEAMDEAELDRQYHDYKRQFEEWRDANKDHPDKEAFQQYELQWKSWEAQVASRREQIRLQKAKAGPAHLTTAAGSAVGVGSAGKRHAPTVLPTQRIGFSAAQPMPGVTGSMPAPSHPPISSAAGVMPPTNLSGVPMVPNAPTVIPTAVAGFPGVSATGGPDMMQSMMALMMNPMFMSMMSNPAMMEQFGGMMGASKSTKEKKKKKKDKKKPKEGVSEAEMMKVFTEFMSGEKQSSSDDMADMIAKFLENDASSQEKNRPDSRDSSRSSSPEEPMKPVMPANPLAMMQMPGIPPMLPVPMAGPPVLPPTSTVAAAVPPPQPIPPPAYSGPGCPPPGPPGTYTLPAPPPLQPNPREAPATAPAVDMASFEGFQPEQYRQEAGYGYGGRLHELMPNGNYNDDYYGGRGGGRKRYHHDWDAVA